MDFMDFMDGQKLYSQKLKSVDACDLKEVYAMKMFAVYFEGDFQVEFHTLKEASDYVKSDIKGFASTYNKTQKWVKDHFEWKIEEVEYK